MLFDTTSFDPVFMGLVLVADEAGILFTSTENEEGCEDIAAHHIEYGNCVLVCPD